MRPLYDADDKIVEAQSPRSSTQNSSIIVDLISEREGQKLRSCLVDLLRDIPIAKEKHRLTIKLSSSEKQFAIAEDGNAKRVMLIYTADVTLRRNRDGKIVIKRSISATSNHNISHAHGEIAFSLYGRHSSSIIKELAHRIIEQIKVGLRNED